MLERPAEERVEAMETAGRVGMEEHEGPGRPQTNGNNLLQFIMMGSLVRETHTHACARERESERGGRAGQGAGEGDGECSD